MKNTVNRENLEGRLYDFDLAKKTVQNKNSKYFGQEFWSGTIHIATDEAGLNVVPVHYTFVLPTFGNGKKDSRFAAFEKITEEQKTWLKVGKDNAEMIKLSPSGDLNDFYSVNDDRMVAAQRNEGGFITFVKELPEEGLSRNKFTYDMIINKVALIEPKEDNPDDVLRARIHGVIFNFKGDILPWDVIAYNPKAIEYFENLGVSTKEPVYTQVWGSVRNTTVKVAREVENAWGDPCIEYSDRPLREWVIEGSRPQFYEFSDEDAAELQKKVADRNVYLAEVKANAIQYEQSRKAAAPTSMAAPVTSVIGGSIPDGDFNDF